ncbi:MAG: SDR family NAD(P)-dependent oxidoreductase, partial [Candidatus Kryptoniota bacterium]
MNISGNTVLITGGATGIGYALTESFLEANNEVIVCGRREERLLEAQKKNPKLHVKVCDVAKEAD